MDSDPLSGTKYRAVRRIGAGGHGEVYESEHLELRRSCIVKLLREALANDASMNERFRIEAQALAALSHPNIVSVTDFGRTQNGAAFFVMERVPGRSLAQVLAERGRIPVAEAIEWTCQALAGLACVHAAGIVHRDLKPSNLLLVTKRDSPPVVKVLDFGIAKILDAGRPRIAPSAYPTEQGTMLGTPKYVSPEQGLGRAVDHRSDIYAMGLVLYSLVTGRGPFDHVRNELTLIAAHVKLEPQPPSHYVDGVSADLDRVVLRALAKRPSDRFGTADDFRRALEIVRSGLKIAPHDSAPYAPNSEGLGVPIDGRSERSVSPFDPTVLVPNQPADSARTAVVPPKTDDSNDKTVETTAPTGDFEMARTMSEDEATMLLEAEVAAGRDAPTRTARPAPKQLDAPAPPHLADNAQKLPKKTITMGTIALGLATTIVIAILVVALLGSFLR